jgi:hypothetical protein
MSNFSINQIIEIARISQYLAENDISKKGLWGGGMDVLLPQKIYAVRKNVEWEQENNPSTEEVSSTATITVTYIGNINDTIEIFVNDPLYGLISIGFATRGPDIVNEIQLADAIANGINGNIYGYTATSSGGVVTITARPDTGASLNGDNLSVITTTEGGTRIATEILEPLLTEDLFNLIIE